MNIAKKLGLFVSLVAAVGSIVKLFSSTERTTPVPSAAATATATNGSLVVSGQGNHINGDVYIQHNHNTSERTADSASEEPAAQAPASRLVGKWRGTSVYDAPGMDLTSTGYSEFLSSGQYNFRGEFTLRNAAKLESGATIVSQLVAAGKWRAEGDKYVITLVDMHTTGTVMKQPGRADVDLDRAAVATGTSPISLEKWFPKGASQEFALLELSQTSMRSTGQDLPGRRVDYEAVRVQ